MRQKGIAYAGCVRTLRGSRTSCRVRLPLGDLVNVLYSQDVHDGQ